MGPFTSFLRCVVSTVTLGLLSPACTNGDGSTTSQGSSSGDGSSGGSGGDITTGSPPDCEDPSDPMIGPAVIVTIRNDRDVPIYLQHADGDGCVELLPFGVLPDIKMTLRGGEWCDDPACGPALPSSCGCDPGCGIATEVLRLEPGATYVSSWSGHTYEYASLAGCGADCGCWATMQAPPRRYSIAVLVSDAVGVDIGMCDTCDCDPGPEGWCVIQGLQSGMQWTVEASLDYPGQVAVEIPIP